MTDVITLPGDPSRNGNRSVAGSAHGGRTLAAVTTEERDPTLGFVLEITGGPDGTIVLEPVGLIDAAAARTLVAALDSLADGDVALRFHRASGATIDARRVLATRDVRPDELLTHA